MRWGVRDLQVESSFEYGSRVGFWQIMQLFKDRDMPISIFAVGLALEHTPWSVPVMMEAGHEIILHGWRWIDYQHVPEDVERDHIRKCVDLQMKMTGQHPLGFFSGRQSPNTRRLLVEEGGFLYDSDAYNDDLPYWVTVSGKPHLVIPYTHDINDSRLALGNGMNLASEFFAYVKDAFDWLYGLGSSNPKMMSVGLHCRTIGRPARIGGLARFLDYVRQHKDVWVCRRVDIARHWQTHHPYQPSAQG